MAAKALENPTLPERLVGLIPLPYPLGAFVWAAILVGPIGFSLLQLAVTGSTTLTAGLVPNSILNVLFTLYAFLMVRYIRLRVLAVEAPIVERLDGGADAYHRAFGRMTRMGPALVLAAALGTSLLVLYAYSGTLPSSPSLLVYNLILVYVNSIAFGTYIWEFASASWGLRALGTSGLRLASFQDDRMMGVRPMGNLALSLTSAYFGGLLIAALLFMTFLPSSVGSTGMFLVFLAAGIALFFLPLTSIHRSMRDEKRRILRAIGARYPRLEADPRPATGTATLDDLDRGLRKLTDLQGLDLLERRAASLPTWPFDIQVVSRFITIVLSVTAVLVGRLLTDLLHI